MCFFILEDGVRKERELVLLAKKKCNFVMRRLIRICRCSIVGKLSDNSHFKC